ncbi:MAG: hypothetical protein ACE5NP_12015 [Anaerolineae bacterium]
MRTPAGVECRFYYEDFHRGRSHQECRLIARNRASAPWRPELCGSCPVPAILRANDCPNMALEGTVRRRFGLLRRVQVDAYCALRLCEVSDPMVGCGECHKHRPGAQLFESDQSG